ncbi:MAG: UDP-N-acetylmuramoyl-tripeptide--D-alanyl-D-alanine ligase [Clostridia bacterium]|nr:UDP-N-acetylmuramoyl-tripeptide--D-alanyl-D-alanine ligase [Clostridia bacterium]
MAKLTLKQAASFCGGQVAPEYEEITFDGACMDTRKIQNGQLFVAIRGESRDGHDYARSAMEAGACAVLAEKPLDADIPAIYAADSRKALGDIARGARKRLNCKVVGITGSVGKTTTKEMMAAVLGSTFATAKTEKNFNNDLGLPMSVLSVTPEKQMAVFEMGMNHFGEMRYLTSIACPDAAVIVNIGTAHIGQLGSREGILKAKLEILEGLQPDGFTVFNGDEPLLWNLKDQLQPKPVYFGINNPDCDLLAANIETTPDGMSFHVRGLSQEFQVFLPVEGLHHVYDALAVITAALKLGVAPTKIQEALGSFRNTGMRQRIYEKNGFTIIEDCYNAGPESMDAALSVLQSHEATGRKIAVLGDMLELGACSPAEHYRIGRLAAFRADRLFTYGKNSARMVLGAITGGMNEKQTSNYETHEALAEALAQTAKPGDVLLFKGSRGMKMECALELFLTKTEKY